MLKSTNKKHKPEGEHTLKLIHRKVSTKNIERGNKIAKAFLTALNTHKQNKK